MSRAILMLGRDGMGECADDADFDAWAAYVCDHIDGACGFEVAVLVRYKGGVQEDHVVADPTDDKQTVKDALQYLWEAFCSDASAWPARAVHA